MNKENRKDNLKPVTLADILNSLNGLDSSKDAEVTRFWGAFSIFWASVEIGATLLTDDDRQKLTKSLSDKFQADPSKLEELKQEQLHT